jgi:hypothetical protein
LALSNEAYAKPAFFLPQNGSTQNMTSRLLQVFFLFVGLSAQAMALDVAATLRRIDSDKRSAVVFANGRERVVKISEKVEVLDQNGKALNGGLAASELKPDTIVQLHVDREEGAMIIQSIRLGDRLGRSGRTDQERKSPAKNSVGFKPLDEMSAEDRYQGEDGGLYGAGRNAMPDSLFAAAKEKTAKVVPRETDGNPAVDGRIGLISISMSNATQEFARFKQLAHADSQKSSKVSVVDCAQGGQTMARWADAQAACWKEADRRLQSAGVSHGQVQVAWIKLANASPSGDLREHGEQLEQDTRKVLANLVKKFPNLRIAYLGSRIYGGYAESRLNPEPYAYEGAFVVRWLIQSQMKKDARLNFDHASGNVGSPLLLWGPYFWSDGMTPRKSDGQVWERSDFASDGTHPSDSGRTKVAEQLLKFFKTDSLARTWFVKK